MVNSVVSLKKIPKNRTTIRSSNPTSECISKRTEIRISKRQLNSHVHYSIICNSKDMETTLVSIYRCKRKRKCRWNIFGYVLICSVVSNLVWPCGLQPAKLLCPLDFLGKNCRVGCYFLLQGIFPTQESNLHLLCLLVWQVDSLPLAPLRKPMMGYRVEYYSV